MKFAYKNSKVEKIFMTEVISISEDKSIHSYNDRQNQFIFPDLVDSFVMFSSIHISQKKGN